MSNDTTDESQPKGRRGFGDSFSSGDDDMGASHGSPGWIAPFVSWVRGEVEILDFDGASVPNLLRDLLKAAGVKSSGAKPHGHVEPEHDIPDQD